MRLAYQKVNPSGIPDEYTELEYLESSGTQYIDTGYIPTFPFKSELVFANTTITSAARYLAMYDSETSFLRWSCAYNSAGTLKCDFGNSPEFNVGSTTMVAGTYYDVITDIGTNSQKFYVDDDLKGSASYDYSSITATRPLYLFAANFTGTVNNYSTIRVKKCKIWDNGTIVRNFIPALKKSTNEVGMYDTVTCTFYTNAGTGTFTGGTIKQVSKPLFCYTRNIPSEYQELEYIQSSGTQYIDTGFASTTGYMCKTKLSIQANQTQILIGTQLGTDGKSSTRSMLFTNAGLFKLGCTGNEYSGSSFALNTVYNIEFSTTSNYYLTVNGTKQLSGTNTNARGPYNINIFCGSAGGQKTGYFSKMTLYYCQLYNSNGELVRNYIPAKRNSDSVLGMYDTVTSTFYTNAGTGTFIAGNEIKPTLRFIETGV